MPRAHLIIFAAIGAIALATVLVIVGILPGLRERGPKSFTLTVWSPEDPPRLWEEISAEYRQKEVPAAKFQYRKKDPKTYEAELLNALAAGEGPDVFLVRHTWLDAYGDKTAPLADGDLGYRPETVRGTFADGIADEIVGERGELRGMPLAFDTVALFYNRDYFNAANIPTPARRWEELVEQTQKLTRLSPVGTIQRAGAALGTANNVERAPEILTALIHQSGGMLVNARERTGALEGPATESALAFYVSFATPAKKSYSWSGAMKNSLEAFARGEAAMAFGYASDVKTINAINPHLNFATAPLPQITGEDTQVNVGRFDLFVVSRLSEHPDQAWMFLTWLGESDVNKRYIDTLGLPPARRALVLSRPPREYLGPFYDQVLSARATPVAGGEVIVESIRAMIDAVATGRFSIQDAISRANNEINAALRRRP